MVKLFLQIFLMYQTITPELAGFKFLFPFVSTFTFIFGATHFYFHAQGYIH